MKSDVIIIGGGLAGLTTAWLLEKKGIKPTILEARDRLGGRIHTIRKSGEAPVEMGATWLGPQHRFLIELLDELGVKRTDQKMGDKAFYEYISTAPPQLVQLPPNDHPTWRINGGSDRLIDALTKNLQSSIIKLNQPVKTVRKNEQLTVETNSNRFDADYVVATLPPKLLVETISFEPELPDQFMNIARNSHTWMGESIKVGMTYSKPFWEDENLSGTIMSNVGPVNEMYDHSDPANNLFALKGFLNGAYASVSREKRKEVVLNQLRRYYGQKADHYLTYTETVWRHEPYTFVEYENSVLPHQNNGNSEYQHAYWNGKLLFAGAETSPVSPGYMDGAVESAGRVVKQIEEN